jgi:hypothetical protein
MHFYYKCSSVTEALPLQKHLLQMQFCYRSASLYWICC